MSILVNVSFNIKSKSDMKSNRFDTIVLENLVLTTDLRALPKRILEDFVVLEGSVYKENYIDEKRKIFMYFDYNFYLDILIDIAKHKDKEELIFSDIITGNFIQIGDKCYCSRGFVVSNKKILFGYEQNQKV